ncbi:MAG: hypothetical protein LBP58_10820 [Azoarcus sp.]|jgi:hypothetical protein|nr:hypothetical protein [Azoarcus sp.]
MDYFLLINARGIEAWQSTRRGIERAVAFSAADADAPVRLHGWLAGMRSRCTPVADLPDEHHILEWLPRVPSADRRLLIERRLAQHFPDTPLTSARPLPAAPGDGPLDPVLLAALTRPADIVPWLKTLGEAGTNGLTEVRAPTSVPFLLERWYRRQRQLPAQVLLLALGKDGMRQMFFRQRRLMFSRVIPARGDALVDCLPVYRDELAQTLAWLPSQRLSDGPAPVRMLATADDLPVLCEIALAAGNEVAFIDLARHVEAHDGSPPVSGILALALQEARRVGPLGHYAYPQLHCARQVARTRRIVIAVGMTLAVSGLAAAAVDLAAAESLREETGQIAIRQQGLQREIDRLDANAAQATDADRLDAWLDGCERLVHAKGTAPETVLQAVADLLAEAPWARLETLAWARTQDGQAPALLPGFATKDFPAGDAASAVVALEISLEGHAPPPEPAAVSLAAHWQRLRGSLAQVEVDGDAALLRFRAALPLADVGTSPLQASAP